MSSLLLVWLDRNAPDRLEAVRLLDDRRFTVVGDGPLRRELQQRAPENVEFVGAVSDDELWSHYARARVHLALSHEDFGITPLEAAHAGVPSVARRSGGYLDTIVESTGILIDESAITPDGVRRALIDALARTWDRGELQRHAATFSSEAHLARLHQVIDEL